MGAKGRSKSQGERVKGGGVGVEGRGGGRWRRGQGGGGRMWSRNQREGGKEVGQEEGGGVERRGRVWACTPLMNISSRVLRAASELPR